VKSLNTSKWQVNNIFDTANPLLTVHSEGISFTSCMCPIYIYESNYIIVKAKSDEKWRGRN